MKQGKLFFAAFIILLLVSEVSAIDYLARLRELDQTLICLIVQFVPAVMAIMIVGAGLLYLTGEENHRALAKTLIMNAVIGFLLVFVFVFISMALLPSISIDNCF